MPSFPVLPESKAFLFFVLVLVLVLAPCRRIENEDEDEDEDEFFSALVSQPKPFRELLHGTN